MLKLAVSIDGWWKAPGMRVKNKDAIQTRQPNELSPGNLREEINKQKKIAVFEDMLTGALSST